MQPFREKLLCNVLDHQWDLIVKKIEGLSNDVIMANDLEILTENLYQEFFIEPLEIFEEDSSIRSLTQEKIVINNSSPFYGAYIGRTVVDGVVGVFYFSYQGYKELFKCQATTFSMSGYPDITVSDHNISFRVEIPLNKMKEKKDADRLMEEINQMAAQIRSGAEYVNEDVKKFNSSLKERIMKKLKEKKTSVELFFNLAQMLEVPVEKNEYALKHIPLSRKIVPIENQYQKDPYYGILDSDYSDILETIKHSASTFERTPKPFSQMQEEDLRDILLSMLNGTYKGNANGEAFRHKGKTDICIERENRAAFVAECKMWKGKNAVSKAIEQLNSYLTWRDCKTALIYFVRRANFMEILESARTALEEDENIRKIVDVDKNEFDCSYISESKPGQLIKIRVMLFDIYYPEKNK